MPKAGVKRLSGLLADAEMPSSKMVKKYDNHEVLVLNCQTQLNPAYRTVAGSYKTMSI